MNTFIYFNVASVALLQKRITIPMVLGYLPSESQFSKMNRTTRIALWMLTYACIIILNCRYTNRDLWITVWKYPNFIIKMEWSLVCNVSLDSHSEVRPILGWYSMAYQPVVKFFVHFCVHINLLIRFCNCCSSSWTEIILPLINNQQ